MDIRYIGKMRRVTFEEAPDRWVACNRGDVIEVADELGRGLLEQSDNWELAGTPERPPRKAKKDELVAYAEAMGMVGPETPERTAKEWNEVFDAAEQAAIEENTDDADEAPTDDQEV